MRIKRYKRLVFPAVFLAVAIIVIWFLALFTRTDKTMSYINWDTAVQIFPDGTEEPVSLDIYGNGGDYSGTYRFSGTLPEGLGPGELVFETNSMALSLSLNGRVLWQSLASSVNGAYSSSQAYISLPEDASGELLLTCEIADETPTIFPPLVRFIPENLEVAENTAFANCAALPAGAAALALVLVFGVFLLGLSRCRADFSLIPLLVSLAGLVLFPLVPSVSVYFLPDLFSSGQSKDVIGAIVILALIVYLSLNRRRRFWNYLGTAALWSAAGLLVCCLFSAARDGYFFYYISSLFLELAAGIYTKILYWLTFWLALTAAIISAYGVFRSFSEQMVQTQGLLLKNKIAVENYQSLKSRMTESAKTRHEIRHQLTAIDVLLRKKDYPAAADLLEQMLGGQSLRIPLAFTGNLAVNMILQDAAVRAGQADIAFESSVQIPDSLNIPEEDLCTLLMNMLDNALEGAKKVFPEEDRHISVHIRVSDGYLAIRCENSFDGNLKKDRLGRLLTTKNDNVSHGFGCRQMEEVARKYQSTVCFDTPDAHTFTAETALLIPSS